MELLLAALALGASVVSTVLLGGRLRRLLVPRRLVAIEALIADHVTGLALLALTGTLLGFAGAYRPAVLIPLLLSGVLVDPRRLLGLHRELGAAWASVRPRGRAELLVLVGVLPFAALGLAGALLPEVFYDTLSYHLGLQSQALLEGRLAILPSVVQSAWPSAMSVLFAEQLALGGLASAKLLSWWTFLLCGPVALMLARRCGFRRGSLVPPLSLLVLLSVPGPVIMSTTATIDHGLMLFAGVAILLLLAAGSRPALGPFLLSGLAMGTVVASKYTGLQVYAALAAAWLVLASRRRVPLTRVLAWIAVVLLVASPWYLRNAIELGNPVYPAFDSVFGPNEDAAWASQRLAGDRATFDRSLGGVVEALRAQLAGASGLGSGASLGWLLPLVALLLPVALLPRSPLARTRALLAVLVVTWLLWFSLQPGGRYLYPVYPIAAICVGWLLAQALRARPPIRVVAFLLVAAGLASNLMQASAALSAIHGGLRVPAGVASVVADPDPHLDRLFGHHPAARWINETTPPEARVLLLGETRLLYFERRLLFSSAYDRHVVQDWLDEDPTTEGLLRRLREEGVTHVLIHWSEVERLGRGRGHLSFAPGEERPLSAALAQMPRVFARGRVEIRALPDGHSR